MKQVLFNLAMLDALSFCKEHKIDPSGTHLYKFPRGYTYSLKRDEDGLLLMTTTFHKNQTPTHTVNPSIKYTN